MKEQRGPRQLETKGSLRMYAHTGTPRKELHLIKMNWGVPPFPRRDGGIPSFYNPFSSHFPLQKDDLGLRCEQDLIKWGGEEILRMERPSDLGGEGKSSGPAARLFRPLPLFSPPSFPVPSFPSSSSPAATQLKPGVLRTSQAASGPLDLTLLQRKAPGKSLRSLGPISCIYKLSVGPE